jgi:hypothetical protein
MVAENMASSVQNDKDSWAVVTATMVLVFIVIKYIARGISYISAPLIILARHLTNRYAKQINAFTSWIKSKLRTLRRRNVNFGN